MLRLTTVYFLIAGSILAVIHVISTELFLYWRFWWLDIPMHVLGGAVVGLALYTARDIRLLPASMRFELWQVLLAVFVLGLGWEAYELAIGKVEPGFYDDTVSDLAMGLLGGAIAYVVAQTGSIEE